MGKDEMKAVQDVMESGWLSGGPKTQQFEEAFAKKVGADYAVSVFNGTIALDLALYTLGVKGKIAVPALSFIASATTIIHNRCEPVFVDVDERTFNISPDDLSRKTRLGLNAVIPVALYGQSYDAEAVERIARSNNLKIVQDLAQAHGALFRKKDLISFGDIACYSFYATKNITTLGEGGMVVTNSKKDYDYMKSLVNQGQSSKYVHPYVGFNYRMTEAQAAVGIVQLKKLDSIKKARQNNARALIKAFESSKHFQPPFIDQRCEHIFHMFTATTDLDRDSVIEKFHASGIDAKPVYPIPIYEQEAFKDHRLGAPCPVSKKLTQTAFHLPVHQHLQKTDISLLIKAIQEIDG